MIDKIGRLFSIKRKDASDLEEEVAESDFENEIKEKNQHKIFFDESADEHRSRLVKEIIDGDADLEQAHKIILETIEQFDEPIRSELMIHDARYLQSYKMMPKAPPGGRLIEVWDMIINPLCFLKGWTIESPVAVDGFNLESDILPFDNNELDGALLCEVMEHFAFDPMWCLIEINRVLKVGAPFLVTVPNAASWYSIYRALQGLQPNRYACYGATPETRRNSIHAREYCVHEVHAILEASGFEVCETTTLDYGHSPPFVPLAGFDATNRGETIFCLVRKSGLPSMRAITPVYTADVPFERYAERPCDVRPVRKPPFLVPPGR